MMPLSLFTLLKWLILTLLLQVYSNTFILAAIFDIPTSILAYGIGETFYQFASAYFNSLYLLAVG